MDLESTLSGGLHERVAAENFKVNAAGSEAKHIIDLLQAEAQGRLVVLPCKVGDKLYSYATYPVQRVWDMKVIQVSFTAESAEWHFFTDKNNTVHLSDFGKTVFLTHEEAEAVLRYRCTF